MKCLVLGFHKSGTTLTASILHSSGINMGDFEGAQTYDLGNKCEDNGVRLLHDKLFFGSSGSLDIPETPITSTDGYSDTLREYAQERSMHSDWGFKDPRTLLVYDSVWKGILGEHKCIFVFRNPLEVAAHYQKHVINKNIRFRFNRYVESLLAWATYNNCLIRTYLATPDSDRFILRYDLLMSNDSELLKLLNFVGQNKSISDQRKKSMYSSNRESYLYYLAKVYVRIKYKISINALFSDLSKLHLRERLLP